MIEFGKTLREAREAKGLTISQIAETTHLLSQIVEDMENEDFHRISAPIYGRGFVKLYCEAVGIEPKPLVDEFMAILNGERQPAIRMKAVELPPEETAPVAPPPPVYTQPELGESEDEGVRQETRDASVGQGVRPETRDASLGQGVRPETRDASERLETPPERQYHPDYARSARDFGSMPNFGRLAILAGGALAIIALLVWGGRALYRASMGISDMPEAQPVDAASSPRQEEAKAAKPASAEASAGAQKTRGANTDKGKRQETRDASADKRQETRGAGKRQETRGAGGDKKTKDSVAPKKPATKRQPKEVPPLYID